MPLPAHLSQSWKLAHTLPAHTSPLHAIVTESSTETQKNKLKKTQVQQMFEKLKADRTFI